MATDNRLKLEVDITIENIQAVGNAIKNGEEFSYEIVENFQGLGYDTQPSKVVKELIVPETIPVGGIADFKSRVFQDTYGDFDLSVDTIESFTYDGEDLIACGGNFTEYTFEGNTTSLNGYVILKADGSIYQGINYSIFDTLGLGERVKAIKFHEINQSLIIGGNFNINSGQDLIELDLSTGELSSRMNGFNLQGSIGNSTGGVEGIDIRQSNGVIVLIGKFQEILNNTSKFIGILNSELQLIPSSIYFNTREAFKAGSNLNSVQVKQSGDFVIYIGGDFNYSQTESFIKAERSHFVAINIKGLPILNFSDTDNTVNAILDRGGRIYIGGQFNNYGSQPVGKLFRVLSSGEYEPNFEFNIDAFAVNVIERGDDKGIYVGFSGISEYNLVRVNQDTGELSNRLNFDPGVIVLKYLPAVSSRQAGQIVVGGNITSFESTDFEVGPNEIRVFKDDITLTRNAIYDNLVEFNTRDEDLGFRYSKVGNDIIRINKIIESETDVYFLRDIENIEGKINVNVNRNDVSLLDVVQYVPLRKDFFIQSRVRDEWSDVVFKLEVQNSINSTLNYELEVTKPRISNSQIRQYLNISPLLDVQQLESDVDYLNNLDYGGFTPVLNDSNAGQLINSNTDVRLADTVLTTSSELLFTTDGYKDLEPILINGDKRIVTDEKFVVPFISPFVKNIEIIVGDVQTLVNNPDFNNVDPEDVKGFIKYLTMDLSQMPSKELTVRFANNDEVIRTIKLTKASFSCLYEPVRVTFKNSFGLLEMLYMNGRSVDNISTSKESYKRDLRDVNGSIQLTNKHQNRTYNKTGEREWDLNTGNVDETMNDVYEDLIMSQEVWITKDGITRPVIMTDSNFNKQQDLSDDVINYTFRFMEDKQINQ